MRTSTSSTGGALRRATGVLVLAAGLGVLVAACAAGAGVRIRPDRPTATVPAAPASPPDSSVPTAIAERPVHIGIDAIGVDAPVVPVGLRPDGAMETPQRGRVGWYRPGPVPGAVGAAVVTAHVDSTAGPDVFHDLRTLRPGDVVTVQDTARRTHHFRVTRVGQFPKTRLPVDRIWDDPVRPGLRLITCGGSFDPSTGHYRDNVIVWATGITGS